MGVDLESIEKQTSPALFGEVCFFDFLFLIQMSFEAHHTIGADLCIVDRTRWQVEAIACVQGDLLFEQGQSKGNAAPYHIDHLVETMFVRRVNIMRAV